MLTSPLKSILIAYENRATQIILVSCVWTSTAKKREGQSARRANGSGDERKWQMEDNYWARVTALGVFFYWSRLLLSKEWQLRLVMPSTSEKKVNKASSACEIAFLRFYHYSCPSFGSMPFLSSPHSTIFPGPVCVCVCSRRCSRASANNRKKTSNKRLKHKRSILSVVLVMINHNGVQLLNTVWYGRLWL